MCAGKDLKCSEKKKKRFSSLTAILEMLLQSSEKKRIAEVFHSVNTYYVGLRRMIWFSVLFAQVMLISSEVATRGVLLKRCS